jgi:hypothetical protein
MSVFPSPAAAGSLDELGQSDATSEIPRASASTHMSASMSSGA